MTIRALWLLGALALGAGCGTTSSSSDDLAGGDNDAGATDDMGFNPGATVKIDVSSVFPPGTPLSDHYSGNAITVGNDGIVTLTPDPSGVVLLEKAGAVPSPFSWADATVYYAVVDRFNNGDPANDGSYGRKKDGQMEVGTWHGGDWKGLTAKLDYLSTLGVTALWISPVVENVHGWVAGGSGDFKHYGYAGYWALDYTRLDQNFGSQADLQELVDSAHSRGIRVLVDVVINHPGYATGQDMAELFPKVLFDPSGAAYKAFDSGMTNQFQKWNDLVNYNSSSWVEWWGPKWIRAGFPGFDLGGMDDQTKQLAFLPDFKTEAMTIADAPQFLTRKKDTGFVPQPNTTVRQYLVKWHSDWVRQLGVDGFRCDTAKNVELGSWKELKTASVAALKDWKMANPGKKLDDAPFWMVGEVFPHGVMKDAYYTDGGFDSLINFDFQRQLTMILQTNTQLATAPDDLDSIYVSQANAVANDASFGILNYISSHDTRLTFDYFGNNAGKQRHAGTALLLAPGGAQIYYGDESGRKVGPYLSDNVQGTRSDMNWGSTDASILAHWQKLGAFRKKHAAVGGGVHKRLASPAGTYAFSRTTANDQVIVVVTAAQ